MPIRTKVAYCQQTKQDVFFEIEYNEIPHSYPKRFKKMKIRNDYCPQNRDECPLFQKEGKCPLYKQFPIEDL